MDNPYKMSYHIEPEQGLMNDPNGFVQFKDTYYFFHQWNRFCLDHSYKEWGLFTSKDMIHWENRGTAIVPDREEDRHGVHSGSGIQYDGRMYLFYTGSNKDYGKRKSRQCIAVSDDGRIFVKHKEVIHTPEGFTEHFRDPKVWRGSRNWWMIVGGQKQDLTGAVVLYSSRDLLHWNYEQVLYEQGLDNMCECPDLYSLDGKIDILTCCPQKRTVIPDALGEREELASYAAYIPGVFNEERRIFIPSQPQRLFDYGFDFYSPQSFLDNKGRRIVAGWMSRMDDEQEACCPTRDFGYLHCLTLPRVLTWENNMLHQRPIEEITQLRRSSQSYTQSSGNFDAENGQFELLLRRKVPEGPLTLSLRNGVVLITYMPQTQCLQVQRKNWADGKLETRQLVLPELFQLQIFSDNSSAEIFVNDGAAVFSMRYFTGADNLKIEYAGLQQEERLEYFSL